MTWSRIKLDGTGRIRARLVIEGLDREFVTDASLAGAGSDGRTRCVGLLLDGLVIDNGTDMLAGRIKASGMTARIADIDEQATAAFAAIPTAVTYLSQTINTSATTVDVDSTSGFASSGYVHIGTECISYSGVTGSSFTGCVRNRRDTVAVSHYSSDGVNTVRSEVTSSPTSIEGRRAYLFAYGDNDFGDGSLVFAGIVSRDATLDDGVYWSVTIDPISRALAAEMGGDLATPPKIRGIYYPWDGALCISLSESSTASSNGTTANSATYRFCGFFETQSAFVEALNTRLATMTSGWNTTIRAIVIDGGQGWTVQVMTSGTARFLGFVFMSLIDPQITSASLYERGPLNDDGSPATPISTLSTNTTYVAVPGGSVYTDRRRMVYVGGALGGVPRASFTSQLAAPTAGGPYTSTLESDATSFPSNRIYIDQEGGSTYEVLRIPRGDTNDLIEIHLDSSQADDTSKYIAFDYVRNGIDSTCSFGLIDAVEMQPERQLASGLFGGNGLAAFLDYVIPQSQLVCDIGGLPLLQLRGNDSVFADASDYQGVIAAAQGGRPYATERSYSSIRKTKFDEYLAHELRMLSLFPRINASGRIEFRPMRLYAPTESSTYTIDASTELVSVGWSSWERNAFGSVSEIRLLTGYDPNEDKHVGPMFRVRDLSALARNKTPRVVEIAPRSHSGHMPTVEDVQRLAMSMLGIFGRSYAVATINVPYTLFDALPGDTVTITSTTLPSSSGVRGMVNVQGVVLHRRWELGKAHGTLTVLVHGQSISGYTPSIYVSATVNTTGNTWELYCDTATPPFDADSTNFATGMRVRVRRWDSDDFSGDRSGTVVSVVGTQVVVTFDSTFTPSTHRWILGFAKSDDASMTSAQWQYAFVASSSNLVDEGSTLRPARTFAP